MNIHVNIEIQPVFVVLFLLPNDRWSQQILGASSTKPRDEVHCTNHHVWVQETEGPRFAGRDESNLVKTFGLPASTGIKISAEPADTKDIHSLRHRECIVGLLDLYKNMEYMYNTGVPVWVLVRFFVLVQENHNV